MQITDDTPIAMLTVGQLRGVLSFFAVQKDDDTPKLEQSKKYLYGIKGIRQLFNVSHATAQRYKDTFLSPAISQNGRKIIVDVDKAVELFSKRK